MPDQPVYKAIKGKTYSLFGNSDLTDTYYNEIEQQVDKLLIISGSKDLLLQKIRKASKAGIIRKKLLGRVPTGQARQILEKMDDGIKTYITEINRHLTDQKFKDCGSSIGTLQWQYYLFMLEIELVNRINAVKFRKAAYRFALLPHCLRDIWENCNAEFSEFDFACRHCRQQCYLNHISRILKEYGIQPFIWTTRDLKQMFREIAIKHHDFAVLGIACIPELVAGMRRSSKYGIPAIGIPLNANCCVRWFGEYRENSVDLEQLKKLLEKDA